jgi:hypothetical protein
MAERAVSPLAAPSARPILRREISITGTNPIAHVNSTCLQRVEVRPSESRTCEARSTCSPADHLRLRHIVKPLFDVVGVAENQFRRIGEPLPNSFDAISAWLAVLDVTEFADRLQERGADIDLSVFGALRFDAELLDFVPSWMPTPSGKLKSLDRASVLTPRSWRPLVAVTRPRRRACRVRELAGGQRSPEMP